MAGRRTPVPGRPAAGPGTCSLCSEAELPEVVALVNSAYRGANGAIGWTSEVGLIDGERVTLDDLRRQLATTPPPRIYLMREPPELLACVLVEDGHGAGSEPTCHIGMLAVRPEWQDAGLGRRMLEFAEAEGRARGARAARISVVSRRASLIAWYERRGYRRTGEIEPFPYDAAPVAEPQKRRLEFVLMQKNLISGERRDGYP